MATFENDARGRLSTELQNEIETASHWSSYNHRWDIGFQVLILLFAIATVICSGIATSELYLNPKPWSLVSTILAGISAVISGFAFSNLAFGKRQRLWQIKKNALVSLRNELQYSNPAVPDFLGSLDKVRAWDDSTDPGAI